jgi:hypothetical protein
MSTEQTSECLDDWYPKRKVGISKSVDYIDIQLAPLQKNSEHFFLSATYVSRFQCGQPWWNNKYPNDIHPLPMCSKTCCGLP